jgi:hypothetical protein
VLERSYIVSKLKPEQIKLYRRVFHQERDKGQSVESSNAEGLAAVKAWDESGAFDAPVDITASSAWEIVASTLRDKFPDAFDAAHEALTRHNVDGKTGHIDMAQLKKDLSELKAEMSRIAQRTTPLFTFVDDQPNSPMAPLTADKDMPGDGFGPESVAKGIIDFCSKTQQAPAIKIGWNAVMVQHGFVATLDCLERHGLASDFLVKDDAAIIEATTSRGANLLPLIRDKGLVEALAEYAKANA